MPHISTVDKIFLDVLFEMESGYVLDFTNKTFAEFFARDVGIEIEHPSFAKDGTSKARRLRCFLRLADAATARRALEALWSYRQQRQQHLRKAEAVMDAHERFSALLKSLESPVGACPAQAYPFATVGDPHRDQRFLKLRQELYDVRNLAPHARGYAFESFLQNLFGSSDLQPRAPFRLVGEQIDGSFQLGSDIYLVEAKWLQGPVGVAELHTFHGKVDQKAAWTRGLFISYAGFTDVGLVAFGRGKKVICMSGEDIYLALGAKVPVRELVERKVRVAAETGNPFVSYRQLYPA
ncbi:restriction endonuclease [Stutzerimonas stutzeri]|uniref:restriction endonuclease n=1 Tax=Stutzerimonas stutzeri TaxID=316 RepID=UPI0030139972